VVARRYVDTASKRTTALRWTTFCAASSASVTPARSVVPYTRADVEASLFGDLFRMTGHSFFEKYVYQVNSSPPMEGLEAAGWRVVLQTQPQITNLFMPISPMLPSYFSTASIGIDLQKDGTISEVFPGHPSLRRRIRTEHEGDGRRWNCVLS